MITSQEIENKIREFVRRINFRKENSRKCDSQILETQDKIREIEERIKNEQKEIQELNKVLQKRKEKEERLKDGILDCKLEIEKVENKGNEEINRSREIEQKVHDEFRNLAELVKIEESGIGSPLSKYYEEESAKVVYERVKSFLIQERLISG